MAKNFDIGQKVVYPTHGVGKIISIENQRLLGKEVKMYVIDFLKDKMVLKIPINRAKLDGLRSLTDASDLKGIYSLLQTKAQTSNHKMWSRRAQEYNDKIHSGNIIHVAEVVRDLYRDKESISSYSERSIYNTALQRLAKEISELENTGIEDITDRLISILDSKIA